MEDGQGGGAPGGPTVARILLGVRLRRLREELNISRTQAAYAIRASDSKIGRMELGRSPFKERDVDDLLTLYGVTDTAEREPLLRLARESAGPGWWQQFGDLISAGTEHYFGLEQAAGLIRLYDAQLVPDLLQTPEYAQAVTELRHAGCTGTEIVRQLTMQMERQRRFFRRPGRKLWVVLDEAVLRRPWGGPAVMRTQLSHLLRMGERPNLTIQVVPFTAVSALGPGVAFTCFRFDEPDLPDVMHFDQATGAYFIDRPDDSERFSMLMDRLATTALPPRDSRALLGEALDRL